MHIGGDIIGTGSFDGQSNLSGFNNVTATAFFGDGAGLSNTGADITTSTANTDERVVLTNITSGTMTDAKVDDDLKFNFSTNKLKCGDGTNGGFVGKLEGDVVGNVTGDVTGNASSATTAGNLSFGSANQVVVKNASNNGATFAALQFDGSTLSLVGDFSLSSGKATIDSIQIDGSTISNVNSSPNQAIFIKPKGDANVKIGTNSNNDLEVEGDIIAFASSDINLKKDISPIQNALDMINSISGNTFTWIKGHKYEGQDDTGILAQEIEALGLPGVTTTRGDGVKAVRYDRLIPVLIEAVKELTDKVKSLESNK